MYPAADPADWAGLDRIDEEIKRLRHEIQESSTRGHDDNDLDLRISKDGVATIRQGGEDRLAGISQLPETLSQREYNLARMASKLDKEERFQLRDLYRQERLAKLEGLRRLADEEMPDGSKIDAETLNYLAVDDEDLPAYEPKKMLNQIMHKRDSNEAEYIERALKAKGHDINFIPDEDERERLAVHTLDLEAMATLATQQKERAYLKDKVKQEARSRQSGAWFKKYQTQGDKLEEDIDVHKKPATGKMLDEFIRQGSGSRKAAADYDGAVEDDDDDDDIYQQYKDMAGR